ncbi:hypothetical protein EJ05DRAFT_372967 [Pseudovirgaria hyperparasitica]|uniref:Uncharacterized protein n=1 Tax=Pseudovirgaria hyperparasitica TaxID=470096 RepID=A0A6A6W8Q7_9PEZI|nr:uncharacterized protein EJ05DRAFT_372967 [Pseudovirgaria hyperparasitica]KAF2757957.1 hypothetical protein EJ05DRAFT_372967 [Pseudovirgaria hyperparasitica]
MCLWSWSFFSPAYSHSNSHSSSTRQHKTRNHDIRIIHFSVFCLTGYAFFLFFFADVPLFLEMKASRTPLLKFTNAVLRWTKHDCRVALYYIHTY